MEILNVVASLTGGVLGALLTIAINTYFEKRNLLCKVCSYVESLLLNGHYPSEDVLTELNLYEVEISKYFNKRIIQTYSNLYGDIVQCIRLESDITENAIFESYEDFLLNIKFYYKRKQRK